MLFQNGKEMLSESQREFIISNGFLNFWGVIFISSENQGKFH